MHRSPVYVTGTGLVCCLGHSVSEVYQRMCNGECGIRPITRFPASDYPQSNAGQLEADVEEGIRAKYEDDDLAACMIKAAGEEALAPVANSADIDRTRLGLVLATNFGPMETLEWCWRERHDTGEMDADTFAAYNSFLENLAEWFGIGGPRVQLSLSCASGAAAVALAKDWIDAKRVDAVLAVGYDALTEFCWSGLTNLRTISTDAVRPFDARRSGTIFSEGAGAILLQNSVTGIKPLAEVLGAATNNNAFHMTAPAKEAEGSRRVMAAAIRNAGLKPEVIDHVCAHATATVANDETEAAALRNLFASRINQMTVAAHKAQLGHMMGAAGIAEAIVTVEVLRHGLIPPTVNCEVMDDACRLDCIQGVTRSRKVITALTNSAGIGGNNSSLVLRAVQ